MTIQETDVLQHLKNILSWSRPEAGESAEQTLARVQYNLRAVIRSMSKETSAVDELAS